MGCEALTKLNIKQHTKCVIDNTTDSLSTLSNIQKPEDITIQKKKSLMVLILSSLIPSTLWAFFILSPVFMSSGGESGFAGVALITIGINATPILIGINIGGYFLGIKLLKLPRLRSRAILVPIVTGIISANLFFIYYAVSISIVTAKYADLNPSASLVEEKIVSPFTTGEVSFTDYEYKINLYNDTNKTFDKVPIFVSLRYFDKDLSKNVHLGGSRSIYMDIKPGNNYIQGTVLINRDSFKNDEFLLTDKLRVLVELSVPNPRKIIINTSPQIDKDLQFYATEAKEEIENSTFLDTFTLPVSNP